MQSDRSTTFKMIAGVLLIYIDIKIISEGGLATVSGIGRAAMIAAMAVFAALGVFFIYAGAKKEKELKKAERQLIEDGKDKTAECEDI